MNGLELYARAMQIVKQYPESANEAVRFQEMCDLLQRDFPSVPDKKIQAIIIGFDERKGLF